jgi:hypothetical protein
LVMKLRCDSRDCIRNDNKAHEYGRKNGEAYQRLFHTVSDRL